jgi:hypothetical protein
MTRRWAEWLLVLGVAILSGCGDDPDPVPAAPVAPPSERPGEVATVEQLRERLRALEDDIARASGDGRCTQAVECRAVGLGSKPCGGPERYWIYSTAASQVDHLLDDAEEHRATDAKLDALVGGVSDCLLELPPVPDCVSGRCVRQAAP